jgi:hypothetical protein
LFCSDDCRSWPLHEKINNHGCWGKHAHIPDNDYWGICLFHVVWTIFFWIKYFHLICHLILIKIICITLKIRSKADFKIKSQNIWQQIIMFSRTVMQMICANCDIYLFVLKSLVEHVSSRTISPASRNMQIRVHVYRPRHCCGDWLTFGCFAPMIASGDVIAYAHCSVDVQNIGCK